MDQGAQAAPLRLLLKDHKEWSNSSGKEIPSRPVVNGQSGYNNHLSEILSLILGPVAREAQGSEINSTGDLLSNIQDMNNSILAKKHSPIEKQKNGSVNDSIQSNEQDLFCDFCSKCNRPPPSQKTVE